MPNKNVITSIENECYYHIFNRGNNLENTFLTDEDYHYFLTNYKQLICPEIETIAYCLLPNHYHFFVYIPPDSEKFLFSKSFKRLIIKHTLRFNNKNNRKGNLFMKPFRRLDVYSPLQMRYLIYYIHSNPLKHSITKNYRLYQFSSFQEIRHNNPWIISMHRIDRLFEGRSNFFAFHDMHDEILLEKPGVSP